MPSRAVRHAALLAALSIVLFGAMPHAGAEAPGIGLGGAEPFAVLAAEGITNTGPTTITGDIGSHPNGAFTDNGTVTLNGTNHGNTQVTADAKTDLVTAYDTAEGAQPVTEGPAQLGNRTLKAGVYTSATGAFLLTGTLTLDAEGVRDAQFIFKAGSEITTASNSVVRLINFADPCHVVWQIGSSATFGTGTTFVGDVLALTSITANTGATFEGRLLARNGTVTLDANTITAGACRAGATVSAPSPTPTPTPTVAPTTQTTTGPAPVTPAGGQPGPVIPTTGGWATAYALVGLALVAIGAVVVRTGNGCRPGRRAVRPAR